MSVIDREWLEQRVAAKKAMIVAFEEAITALGVDGIQQYSLNTGQTTQMVTKANLSSLRTTLQSLENDLATLDARLCGAGHYGQPGF